MVINLWLSDISGSDVLDPLPQLLCQFSHPRHHDPLRIARLFTPLSGSGFLSADQPRSEATTRFFFFFINFVSTYRDCVVSLHKGCSAPKKGLAAVGKKKKKRLHEPFGRLDLLFQ